MINISYINESYIKYILDADDNERNWIRWICIGLANVASIIFIFFKKLLVWSILDLTVSVFSLFIFKWLFPFFLMNVYVCSRKQFHIEPLCMFWVPTLATHVTAVSDLHTPHDGDRSIRPQTNSALMRYGLSYLQL